MIHDWWCTKGKGKVNRCHLLCSTGLKIQWYDSRHVISCVGKLFTAVFIFFWVITVHKISRCLNFYNPNTWFSGILLFFFLMATAFMGYVLPFGQMSFWGATVITNLLSPFPSLIEWVCGGHYVYNPTLKRFFWFSRFEDIRLFVENRLS